MLLQEDKADNRIRYFIKALLLLAVIKELELISLMDVAMSYNYLRVIKFPP